MTTLHVTLDEATERFFRERAEQSGYASLESFVQAVLEQRRREVEERDRIAREVWESLEDPRPSVPMDDEFWRALRAEVLPHREAAA